MPTPLSAGHYKMLLSEKSKRYYHKTRDYLYQKKVLSGNRLYKKFIILGTGRTGSNMLMSALQAHPQVVIYGEIFNNARHDRIGSINRYPSYIKHQKALKIRKEQPIDFLDNHIFRIYPKSTEAVGFKFFYWHCHEHHWKCVWDHLKSMQDLKIIHIKRKNRLDTFLSLKLAQNNKQWSQKQINDEKNQIAVTLDFDECLRSFNDWEEKEVFYDHYFAGHPMLEVFYEHLCEEYDQKIYDIVDFLGLTPLYLKPATLKQARDSKDKVITNYFELKEKFRHTKWGHFFDM